MSCWGKGIERMLSECSSAGIPSPDFIADDHSVTIVFRLSRDAPEPVMEPEDTEVTIVQDHDDLEARIIGLVAEGSLRTGPEFAEALGINRRQFTRVMSKLMNDGVIIREGNKRKGRWSISKEYSSTGE